ncbi:uncharacterized protein LOC116405986 [Cucumis sativus]|uniref:uncharacterized protein LOC116405986 n=1 Tax=Cucumis sativus TaxID=3659 RepID=UPI0012F4EEA4|nr:uncharacterized protein LOC116405986 [Cucumis sativus]
MLFSSSLAISTPPSSPILVAISTLFNLNLLDSLTLTGLTSMSLEPPLLLLLLHSSKNPLDYQTLLFLSFLILVSLSTPAVLSYISRSEVVAELAFIFSFYHYLKVFIIIHLVAKYYSWRT